MAIVNPLTLAKAKAFTLWIRGITGTEPTILVYEHPEKNMQVVRVDFTSEQKQQMINWLDRQALSFFTPESVEESDLNINFGGVLLPWSLRYLLPTGLAIFMLGRLTGGRRRK